MAAATRHFLADFVGNRVVVQAFLEKLTKNKNTADRFDLALIVDAEVIVRGMRYELDHNWVQYAEALTKFGEGDKIEFTCEVREYKKDGELQYGLTLPDDVKYLGRRDGVSFRRGETVQKEPVQRPIARPITNGSAEIPKATAVPEQPKPKEEALDPVTAVTEVKKLAKRLGGMDKLKTLIAALEE